MQIAQLIGQQAQKSLSQAENMRLQQLKNGMATVQQQLTSGEIFPHEAEDLVSQLSQQMVPLQQREEEAAAMAEQAQDAALAKANVNQAEGDGFRRAASAKNAGNQIAKLPNPYNGMEEFYWIPEDGSQPQPMFQGGEGAPEGGEVQAFPLAAQFAVGTNPGEGQQQQPLFQDPRQANDAVTWAMQNVEPQRPGEANDAYMSRLRTAVQQRAQLMQEFAPPQQPRPITPYQERQLELSQQRLQQQRLAQQNEPTMHAYIPGVGHVGRGADRLNQPAAATTQYAGTQLDEPVGQQQAPGQQQQQQIQAPEGFTQPQHWGSNWRGDWTPTASLRLQQNIQRLERGNIPNATLGLGYADMIARTLSRYGSLESMPQQDLDAYTDATNRLAEILRGAPNAQQIIQRQGGQPVQQPAPQPAPQQPAPQQPFGLREGTMLPG